MLRINERGFSLVEIVTAIFVPSFAILAIASIFPAGLEMNRKTKIRIRALEIASGIIEEIRDLPYYDPLSTKPDLITLAHASPGGFPMSGWIPRVVDLSELNQVDSSIFFRDSTGKNMRVGSLAPVMLDYPAVRIEPVDVHNSFMYPYGGPLSTPQARIHRITVTVCIEESHAGELHYSYIQVITYRGDSLTTYPGQ